MPGCEAGLFLCLSAYKLGYPQFVITFTTTKHPDLTVHYMANYTFLIPVILLSLLAITIIDTVGAVASRKLNFRYMWLSILSFAVYILVGYIISKEGGLLLAVIVNFLLGFYDATVGNQLAIALKANYMLKDEEKKYLSNHYSIISMMLFSPIMAFIGYLIAR